MTGVQTCALPIYQRKRVGIDKVIHSPLNLIDEKYKYRSIDENITKMIRGQSSKFEIQSNYDTSKLYNENVQITESKAIFPIFPLLSKTIPSPNFL